MHTLCHVPYNICNMNTCHTPYEYTPYNPQRPYVLCITECHLPSAIWYSEYAVCIIPYIQGTCTQSTCHLYKYWSFLWLLPTSNLHHMNTWPTGTIQHSTCGRFHITSWVQVLQYSTTSLPIFPDMRHHYHCQLQYIICTFSVVQCSILITSIKYYNTMAM